MKGFTELFDFRDQVYREWGSYFTIVVHTDVATAAGILADAMAGSDSSATQLASTRLVGMIAAGEFGVSPIFGRTGLPIRMGADRMAELVAADIAQLEDDRASELIIYLARQEFGHRVRVAKTGDPELAELREKLIALLPSDVYFFDEADAAGQVFADRLADHLVSQK